MVQAYCPDTNEANHAKKEGFFCILTTRSFTQPKRHLRIKWTPSFKWEEEMTKKHYIFVMIVLNKMPIWKKHVALCMRYFCTHFTFSTLEKYYIIWKKNHIFYKSFKWWQINHRSLSHTKHYIIGKNISYFLFLTIFLS